MITNLALEREKKLLGRQDERNYNYNHPSELGWCFDCMRHLVLLRTNPEPAKLHTLKRLRILEEGKKQEAIMRQDLLDDGHTLYGFDEPLTWPEYNIMGQPDNLILMPGKKKPLILEYKSCSNQIFREIRSFSRWEDFLNSKFPWIRHYPAQEMTYIALCQANDIEIDPELSILYFKNRESGEEHQIEIYFDDPYVKQILKATQRVNQYVENGTNEEPAYCDACRWCPYEEMDFNGNARPVSDIEKVEDDEAESALERLAALKPLTKEYEELYDRLKESYRGKDVIIGNWKLTTTEFMQKVYNVPENVRLEYEGKAKRQRFNIKPLIEAL